MSRVWRKADAGGRSVPAVQNKEMNENGRQRQWSHVGCAAMDYQDPYYIHRLDRPHLTATDTVAVTKAFGFGCSSGGQLSDEAIRLLAPFFSFAYMGAYEYEDGSVARSLFSIFSRREEYAFFRHEVPATDCRPLPWHLELAIRRKRSQKGRSSVFDGHPGLKVHGFALSGMLSQVVDGIDMMARDKYRPHRDINMSRAAFLPEKPDAKYPYTIGWLDVRNGAMWFLDEATRDGVAGVFMIHNVGVDGAIR